MVSSCYIGRWENSDDLRTNRELDAEADLTLTHNQETRGKQGPAEHTLTNAGSCNRACWIASAFLLCFSSGSSEGIAIKHSSQLNSNATGIKGQKVEV